MGIKNAIVGTVVEVTIQKNGGNALVTARCASPAAGRCLEVSRYIRGHVWASDVESLIAEVSEGRPLLAYGTIEINPIVERFAAIVGDKE